MKSVIRWVSVILIVLGIAGVVYGQEPNGILSEGAIVWSAPYSNDDASVDPGLVKDGSYVYVWYSKDVAVTTVAVNDLEVTVGEETSTYPLAEFEVTCSNVYPMYSPLVAATFSYTGNVPAMLTTVDHDFSELVAFWLINDDTGATVKKCANPGLDLSELAFAEGLPLPDEVPSCLEVLDGLENSLTLNDGDSYRLYLVLHFGELIVQDSETSFSLVFNWSPLLL